MCLTKCLGGLGLRDLELFNESHLAKQEWQLLHDPSSLHPRVLNVNTSMRQNSCLRALEEVHPSFEGTCHRNII